MKREILFRGKRVDTGKFVEGHYYRQITRDTFSPEREVLFEKSFIKKEDGVFDSLFQAVEVDGNTVGQFTGFTDKNGVNIFEDDRIEYHFESHNQPSLRVKEREGVIVWQEFRACWAIQLNKYMNNDLWRHINNVSEKCEVIGNIHDKK